MESPGAAGEAWWAAIDRGVRRTDDLVQALEAVLRAKRIFSFLNEDERIWAQATLVERHSILRMAPQL